MEHPFIQVGTEVFAIAHMVRVHLVAETRYDNDRVMTPAHMMVMLSNNDTYTFTESSEEGKALRAWWKSHTTVLAPQPESEKHA
jgi:hypothetical protein